MGHSTEISYVNKINTIIPVKLIFLSVKSGGTIHSYISKPTNTYAGCTGKSGLATTAPPTYMRACSRQLRAGEAFSRAITSAEHWRCSSARSKSATMLKINERNGLLELKKNRIPFAHVDNLGTLAVNIKRLWLTRQLEHHAVKGCSHLRRGNGYALRVR